MLNPLILTDGSTDNHTLVGIVRRAFQSLARNAEALAIHKDAGAVLISAEFHNGIEAEYVHISAKSGHLFLFVHPSFETSRCTCSSSKLTRPASQWAVIRSLGKKRGPCKPRAKKEISK
jgi:hypothetical protein|tara:strand:- start:436 stop:792 length:357 start_codon:yes stop_codon:yes gene_type:complete